MSGYMLIVTLLPVLGWGMMPVVAKFFRGTSRESMLGTTIIIIFLSLFFLVYDSNLVSGKIFFVSFVSGIFWGIGQWLQFEALEIIDVSKVMPISNGTQLIFTSVIAWLILKEWPGLFWGICEVLCLIFMLTGLYFATKKEIKGTEKIIIKGTILICLSSFSLSLYVSVTKLFHVSGIQVFFPQSLGMFTCAILLWMISKEKVSLKKVGQNFLTGICWFIANVSLFLVSDKLGLGLSFAISQLCVLVAIAGGVFFLKDIKTVKEMTMLKLGSLIMFLSILLLGWFKTK